MSTEIAAALADVVMLLEKNSGDKASIVAALTAQTDALRALALRESPAPVVNSAPTVNVTAPAQPPINVTAKAGETIVQMIEAKSRKVRINVKYNDSGRIDFMDVETVTE